MSCHIGTTILGKEKVVEVSDCAIQKSDGGSYKLSNVGIAPSLTVRPQLPSDAQINRHGSLCGKFEEKGLTDVSQILTQSVRYKAVVCKWNCAVIFCRSSTMHERKTHKHTNLLYMAARRLPYTIAGSKRHWLITNKQTDRPRNCNENQQKMNLCTW